LEQEKSMNAKATETRMPYAEALSIAEKRRAELEPHCYRIEIAGSLRRKRSDIGDIEIVAIPKPYGVGLFESGIASVISQWPAIKGELPCKYTQRILPEGIKIDLFFATPENWGLIFAIRTGSAEFSHHVLATGWVQRGYKSLEGMLHYRDNPIPVREERDLFGLIKIPFVQPEHRL
jgi:DNA polymerase (family 10)